MPNPADQAGPAAPSLPSYRITDLFNQVHADICAKPVDASARVEGYDGLVLPSRVRLALQLDAGRLPPVLVMTPGQARQLAVYLVDCANALDNPLQRVIVDEVGEGVGHE